jgi:hypothetical protein
MSDTKQGDGAPPDKRTDHMWGEEANQLYTAFLLKLSLAWKNKLSALKDTPVSTRIMVADINLVEKAAFHGLSKADEAHWRTWYAQNCILGQTEPQHIIDAAEWSEHIFYYDLPNGLETTSIHNVKHLIAVSLKSTLDEHPWAAFLLWYCDKYDRKDILESLKENLEVTSLAGYTLRFRPRFKYNYDVIMEHGRGSESFQIYNSDAETRFEALRRLKRRVRFLERAYHNNAQTVVKG